MSPEDEDLSSEEEEIRRVRMLKLRQFTLWYARSLCYVICVPSDPSDHYLEKQKKSWGIQRRSGRYREFRKSVSRGKSVAVW